MIRKEPILVGHWRKGGSWGKGGREGGTKEKRGGLKSSLRQSPSRVRANRAYVRIARKELSSKTAHRGLRKGKQNRKRKPKTGVVHGTYVYYTRCVFKSPCTDQNFARV